VAGDIHPCPALATPLLIAGLRRVDVVDDDAAGLAPVLGLQSGPLRQFVVGDEEATPSPVDAESGRVAQSGVARHQLADQSQLDVELDHAATVDVQHQQTAAVVDRQTTRVADPSSCVGNVTTLQYNTVRSVGTRDPWSRTVFTGREHGPQLPLRYPGRRQVRSWSQTCSELEFGPSSISLAAS